MLQSVSVADLLIYRIYHGSTFSLTTLGLTPSVGNVISPVTVGMISSILSVGMAFSE